MQCTGWYWAKAHCWHTHIMFILDRVSSAVRNNPDYRILRKERFITAGNTNIHTYNNNNNNNYYYYYYYLLQFSCHSLPAVLTPVQTKQIRINIHKRNNTKTQYKQYKTLYRVSQEERTKLREGVPYVKLYRYNPKNTYIQSWTVTEIMAREVWNFDSCYTLTDCQIHIETGRNMWFL